LTSPVAALPGPAPRSSRAAQITFPRSPAQHHAASLSSASAVRECGEGWRQRPRERRLTTRRARAGPHGDSGAIAVVLVRGDASQGEMVVELVNAPGATRVVRALMAAPSVDFVSDGRGITPSAGMCKVRYVNVVAHFVLPGRARQVSVSWLQGADLHVKWRAPVWCIPQTCMLQCPRWRAVARSLLPIAARRRQADEHELPMLLSRSIARPPSDRVHGLHWAEDDIEGPALLGGPEQGASPVRPGCPPRERHPAACRCRPAWHCPVSQCWPGPWRACRAVVADLKPPGRAGRPAAAAGGRGVGVHAHAAARVAVPERGDAAGL
jgi:hypothetical protein